jgi:hypothetical protein
MCGFPTGATFLAADPSEILSRFVIEDESGASVGPDGLPGRRALRTGMDAQAVLRFRVEPAADEPAGDERWASVRSTLRRDGHGAVTHVVNVFTDVTADRRRERMQRFLAEAGRELARSLDREATLRRVARLAVPEFADWCAVDLLSDDGTIELIALAHVDPSKVSWAHELRRRFPIDPDDTAGVANVLRTGKPELIEEVTQEMIDAAGIRDPEILDILERLRLSSILYVPLIARGHTLGAIELVWAESGRHYAEPDLRFAEDLANRAALAIDNARLYQARDEVATVLQRDLLPPALPDIPGWSLAARYLPASPQRVGGDFYDAFATDDGGWALTVGDICGKGVLAAALMGTVRRTIRTAALGVHRPSEVLRVLNRAMEQEVTDGRYCTACYVRLRSGGRLTICSGGHPLPLLLRADGTTSTVGAPGTLLGIYPDVDLEDAAVDLGAGDALILFTDGLLDERRRGLAFGETRLVDAVHGAAGAGAAAIAAALHASFDAFLQEGPPDDDVAFLVIAKDAA